MVGGTNGGLMFICAWHFGSIHGTPSGRALHTTGVGARTLFELQAVYVSDHVCSCLLLCLLLVLLILPSEFPTLLCTARSKHVSQAYEADEEADQNHRQARQQI